MSDSPLSCDLPETNIEQQLDKRLYRTYGERLASPSRRFFGNVIFLIFMPSIIWWKFTPFKYKWPNEIEAILGKANYY